jgi:hypothetical protein
VHLAKAGKVCVLCGGTGYMGKETICADCAGVGIMDAHKGDSRGRRGDDPVDERGLMQIAGEPEPGPDALTVAEREGQR